MIFSWFDTREAKQAGQSIAARFIAGIPPDAFERSGKLTAKQKKLIDDIHRQLEQINLERKFNAYKKAKLADAFQQELLKAGYQAKFVTQLTKGLVMKLGYR